MDIDDFVKEIDQNIQWFCDKIMEPIPHSEHDKDKVMKRMMQLGWIRQSEYETYKKVTKDD